MFKTLLLKQSVQWMLAYILPTPAKCFMYIFILIATVWASIAGYYYFSEDYIHSHGASISAGVFGILSLIALIWNSYLESRKPQGDILLQDNILSEIVPKNYLLLKILYDQFKKHYTEKSLKSKMSLLIPVAIGLYLFLRKKRV